MKINILSFVICSLLLVVFGVIWGSLKLFENFGNIDSICKLYGVTNYTINSDGTVDVSGDVIISPNQLTRLPIKFGRVTGNFDCGYNQLTSLEGSPSYVGGYFNCKNNQLTSLEGGPSIVGDLDAGYFDCSDNQLTSLERSPKELNGIFYCYNNKLTSLEGCPPMIGNDYYYLNCSGNPIYNIYNLFTTHKDYIDSLDYNYLRGTDIVKSRFQEALEEIGMKIPKSIKGYNYI